MGTLNTAILLNPWGSDPNAANSAHPTIRIFGDGGNATYQVTVDRVDIGQFHTSDIVGDVDVYMTSPLTDANHVFGFDELSPHLHGPAGFPTPASYAFKVDTLPPAPPVITSVTASGPDTSGKYTLTMRGTADVSTRSIRCFNGAAGIGGATVTAGQWQAVNYPPLSPGTYNITAAAYDTAGNASARSVAWPITLGTVVPPQPTVPGVPPATGVSIVSARDITLSWTAPADGGSPITGYVIRRDGVVIVNAGPTVRSYVDTVVGVALHTYTVSAVNAVGEGPQSPAVTV